ncbi:MAG TPA: TlpA disulfide reductase family protein [Thermoanaerobaculia bacterium]
MRKTTLFLIIVLSFACKRAEQPVAGARGTGTTTQAAPAPAATATVAGGSEVGQQMPAYSAPYLDGKLFSVADRKGKVVLLNLWATWCGPCRVEIPELEKMHAEYSPRGFEVVGVTVDEYPAEAIQKFADQQKMTYPIVLDPEGKLANLFETTVIPTTVLLDRSGKIVWKHQGPVMAKDPELMKALEEALKS